MMTDESLQVITDADRDMDFEVRAHEVFELRLAAKPATGHTWEIIDQPDQVVVESWRWESETENRDEPDDGDTYRVWRIHTTDPGTFRLRLRCWQPWEGESSITNTFTVTIEAT